VAISQEPATNFFKINFFKTNNDLANKLIVLLKKIDFFKVLIPLTFILNSCGGVIGGIKQYNFNLTKTRLESLITTILLRDSALTHNPDSTLYNLKGTGYEDKIKQIFVTEDSVKYVLSFSYLGDSTQWINSNNTTINLISGAKFGDPILLSDSLSAKQKKKYQSLFEVHFIDRVLRQAQANNSALE